MRQIITILFLLLSGSQILAQSDTLNLKQVDVNVLLRQDFNVGSSTCTLDSSVLSQYQNANLGDVLNAETGVFIKTYAFCHRGPTPCLPTPSQASVGSFQVVLA